ncbi:ABC transporter permease [Cryptosporangium japonicum]|uniref:ABC transporter permease n=1 Tax=Cryptosporangium japonicum TaxID=80872 RepID=A0ABN0UXW1_9ACTN
MLTVALSTLRSRWTTFVTTVLTLTLGVALIAAAGVVIAGTVTAPDRPPRRYATAPVVVTPLDELRVRTANGVRVLPLAESRGLPSEVVTRVAELGPVVIDRVFPAGLAGGDSGMVGRPWAAARLGKYRLVAGREPRRTTEVVVPDGGAAVGATVTVSTADETRRYTVAGLTGPVRFERAVFFTDAEAARLSPRVDAVASRAAPASVRASVGDDALVSAGSRRRALDPDHRADTEALVAANAVVGTAAGVSGFVAVFVIASTFAYAVATRRRELALLRTSGATPGQVRRSVMAEGLLLGVIGSAAGCALGGPLARRAATWLVGNGLAPPWFTVAHPRWPFVVAFGAGVLTALLGVVAAAHRAGRIRPVEALRETAVEAAPLTPGRWLFGLATAAGAVFMLVEPVVAAPAEALGRKHYLPATMLLLVAIALLAPLVVPPLARLLGTVTGLLARQAALTASRRTAAMAVPVLLTAGLTGCVLTTTATIDAAKAAENGGLAVSSDLGLGPDAVARLRAVPGVQSVNVVRPTAIYAVDDDAAVVRHTARAVDRVPGVPVLAGDPSALDDGSIVVDAEFGWTVGERVQVWLADGSPRSFRVVAVVREGVGGNGAFVTGRHAGKAVVSWVEVDLAPGASRAEVARGVEVAVRGRGEVATTETSPPARTLGLQVILGLATVLAVLSIIGTTVMAARDRRGESELLGLAGATPLQVVRAKAAEALLVSGLGLVLAAAATALLGASLWVCLWRLTGQPLPVVVPWAPVGSVAAVCVGVTLVSALGASPARRRALGRRA